MSITRADSVSGLLVFDSVATELGPGRLPVARAEVARPSAVAPWSPVAERAFSVQRAAAWAAGLFLTAVIAVALGVPLLVGDSMSVPGAPLLPVGSVGHVWGTDAQGRDLALQVIVGARESLVLALGMSGLAISLGFLLGVLGSYRVRLGTWLMRACALGQALPRLVVMAVGLALVEPGLWETVLLGGLLYAAGSARGVHRVWGRLQRAPYADSARLAGLGEAAVALRVVLPYAWRTIASIFLLNAASALLLEAALGFFGLTAQGSESLGGLLRDALPAQASAWWLCVIPGLALASCVLAFRVLGRACAATREGA